MFEQGVTAHFSRRRMLAFGAATLASAALAACGGSSSATETPKPVASASGGLAGTAQAIATALPTGAASTAQAVASAVPGGAAAVASQVPVSASAAAKPSTAASPAANTANTADVASRNGKYKAPPPMTIDKAKKYTATIATNKGTMKAELYADTAPIAVNNFVFLANDHFYDGVIFHRIVAGFVIQGGDPTGTGTGGPGYKFPDEPVPASRNYEKGTLAMANSGPNTNGSQFFICVDNLTAKGALPKQYTLFGKVTDGLDAIDKILAVPRTAGGDGAQSKPTEKVFMESVTIQTT
ncbi:MAG: peptidylprolyl isomerase [Chloroflexota bacterium]|nr:peptidylprolyl isomerase [Chloroflexota bacterium]